jgi:sulfopyruvate decarboxylase subunit alpha
MEVHLEYSADDWRTGGCGLDSDGFCKLLNDNGFDFFTGVPCSLLGRIIQSLSGGGGFRYVPATREDEALGIAVGAYMGGKKPVVLMQNSGLGNSIDALTSLLLLYEIPVLLIVSWRGYEQTDFIEHSLMGKYMLDFLKTMKIPAIVLSKNELSEQVAKADRMMTELKKPVALVLRKGVVK